MRKMLIFHPTDNVALWKKQGPPFCDCPPPCLSVSVPKRSKAKTRLPDQWDLFVQKSGCFVPTDTKLHWETMKH